jgi:hypothetical protein
LIKARYRAPCRQIYNANQPRAAISTANSPVTPAIKSYSRMKTLIHETFFLFTNNFKAIALLSLPFLFSSALITQVQSIPTDKTSFILIGIILSIINMAIFAAHVSVIIVFLSEAKYQNYLTYKESMLSGLLHTPMILASYFIVLAPILIFWIVSTNIGRFFDVDVSIIFPLSLGYLYVVLRASFAPFFIILDEEKPINSIKKSFNFTKGFELKLFTLVLFFTIPIALINFGVNHLSKQLGNLAEIASFGSEILFGIISVIMQVAIFTVFCLSYSKNKRA